MAHMAARAGRLRTAAVPLTALHPIATSFREAKSPVLPWTGPFFRTAQVTSGSGSVPCLTSGRRIFAPSQRLAAPANESGCVVWLPLGSCPLRSISGKGSYWVGGVPAAPATSADHRIGPTGQGSAPAERQPGRSSAHLLDFAMQYNLGRTTRNLAHKSLWVKRVQISLLF
jgi:hypothetical protein